MLKRRAFSSIVHSLSPGLRDKLWPHICGSLQDGKVHLASVWYLSTVDKPLLQELALHMRHSAFPAREIVRDSRALGTSAAAAEPCLYIVEKGLVNRGGSIYYPDSGPDSCFGLDMIIHSDLLRDKRAAVSLSYVEVLALGRADLYALLEHYPLSAATVRNAALRLALKQATRLLRHYVSMRQSARDQRSEGGAGGRQVALVSRMQRAFVEEQREEASFVDSDAGAFFRMINGNKLREVGENGTIIETEWVQRRELASPGQRSRSSSPMHASDRPVSPELQPESFLPPAAPAAASLHSASAARQQRPLAVLPNPMALLAGGGNVKIQGDETRALQPFSQLRPSSTEQMAREAAPRVTAPLLLEQMMKRIEGIADEVRALREEQRRHFDPGAGITQHAGADSRLHA